MFKFIKKISSKLSLTKTEAKVFIFLSAVLVLGAGYKLIFKSDRNNKEKKFSYTSEDSLFNIASSAPQYEAAPGTNNPAEQEQQPQLPAEKSININTASREELESLPAIGPKTAESIMVFRKKNHITKLNQLLEIKGIGESKLKLIEKYLFIE